MGRKFIAVGLLLLGVGCSTLPDAPEIVGGGIVPSNLQPGDTAIITVEMQDKFEIVRRVEGVVKEDPSIVFELKDDGIPPDAAADDNVWTLQVDVPFNAPPGSFELTLRALNSDGEQVIIRDEAGEAAPLGVTYNLDIRYADETP